MGCRPMITDDSTGGGGKKSHFYDYVICERSLERSLRPEKKSLVSSPLVWYKPNERASAFFFSITFPILYIDFFTI